MRHFVIIFIALVSALFLPNSLLAKENGEQPVGEMFFGGILSDNSWISWAGAVKSLSGGLYDQGWRIRVLGAYGQYGFQTGGAPNFANPALLEIMPGYQFKKGPLTSKLYFGLHGEHHALHRPDPFNKSAGMGYGAKLLSENWLNLPMNSFVSLDLSYSTLGGSYQGMVRSGMAKFITKLSIGPEAAIIGNEDHYQFRLGAFARYNLTGSAFSGSAGYSLENDKEKSPYFSLSYEKKF